MASIQTGKYPYIPAKSWWALRRRFQQAMPTSTPVTPEYLGSVLDMTPDTARKTVLSGLKLTGLIDEDGSVTNRGMRWRIDDEYSAVCHEILEDAYPEELLHAAPGPEVDRDRVERWFLTRTTLGKNRAGQTASFYQLLADGDPSKGAMESGRTTKKTSGRSSRTATNTNGRVASNPQTPEISDATVPLPPVTVGFTPSVHIDMHFHVSPEARPEQIDKIFESMARHLNLSDNSNGK